jgi:large repetitive protein
MKSERFNRTKSVMASGAIALVVAALVIGASTLVLGPRSAFPQHPGFDLTSGSSSFTITSTTYTTPSGTYPAASCSGTPALLSPGVADCVVFSVHNNLKATISVQSITTTLDTTNYPAPPADCSGTNLVLPTFSGSFNVTGGGNATSPGVPIELKDNGAPQTDCENYTYHLVYAGGANYTEVYGTSTGLVSSQNPSTAGESVTYTATVTASPTSSQDPVPSSPTGTVTFKDNATTICNAPVALTSTGTTTATAKCTVNYTTTAGSPHSITASYVNTDGNFTNSNGSLSQVVNSSTVGTTTALKSSLNPSTYGSLATFTATISPSSGTGTPSGSVTFYNCGSSSNCSSKSAFGSAVTLSSGKATLSTSALPVGTTYVETIYGGSGIYQGSTSNIVAQGVNPLGTTSSLTSSPNPSTYDSSVTFSDTIKASSGTPGGTVTFYRCTTNACSTKTSLGTEPLVSGKATFSTSTLPVATTYVEAVYPATGNYLGSTSIVPQVVVGIPSVCAGGGYSTYIFGNPAFPSIYGTNGNDFIYAFGGNYWINGLGGNDCFDAGDGNNVIFEGDGNVGVSIGNGSNAVVLGNGNDKVSLGNGSDGVVVGNGNDTITLGDGSQSGVVVGNGNDAVSIGTGSYNDVHFGSGTDSVTIESPGSHDTLDGGTGNQTVYLGSGTYNSYSGVKGKTNVCHLPLYNGKAGTAADYHDAITNCTVVSP